LQLIKSHQLLPHAYADDTQIYGFCNPSAADALQERVAACFDDVSAWTAANRLQLNPSKTEVLWCASNRRQHLVTNYTNPSWKRVSASSVNRARPWVPHKL
jgi:hypothetical protein